MGGSARRRDLVSWPSLPRGAVIFVSIALWGCQPRPADQPRPPDAALAGQARSVDVDADARATPSPETLARITDVEAGLLPAIVVSGVDLRMKLADRLAHHGVAAIGVAVIDGGRVAWART